ncbi:MAG: hypothetical protein ACYSVY_20540 [Planctomycetota bacterium]
MRVVDVGQDAQVRLGLGHDLVLAHHPFGHVFGLLGMVLHAMEPQEDELLDLVNIKAGRRRIRELAPSSFELRVDLGTGQWKPA